MPVLLHYDSDLARNFSSPCDVYKVANVVHGNRSITVTGQIHSHPYYSHSCTSKHPAPFPPIYNTHTHTQAHMHAHICTHRHTRAHTHTHATCTLILCCFQFIEHPFTCLYNLIIRGKPKFRQSRCKRNNTEGKKENNKSKKEKLENK